MQLRLILAIVFILSVSTVHTASPRRLTAGEQKYVKKVKTKLLSLFRKQTGRSEARYIMWGQYPPKNWPLSNDGHFYGSWSFQDALTVENNLNNIKFVEEEVEREEQPQARERKAKRPLSPVLKSRITRSSAGDFEVFTVPETSNREVKQLIENINCESTIFTASVLPPLLIDDYDPSYDEAQDTPELRDDDEILDPYHFIDIFDD